MLLYQTACSHIVHSYIPLKSYLKQKDMYRYNIIIKTLLLQQASWIK